MSRFASRLLTSCFTKPRRTAAARSAKPFLNVLGLEDRLAPANFSAAEAGLFPVPPRTDLSPLKLPDFTTTEILVGVRSEEPLAALGSDRGLAGLVAIDKSRVLLRQDGVALVEVRLTPGVDPLVAVKTAQSVADVEWAEPNRIVRNGADWTPNDAQYASQYHLTKSAVDTAWNVQTGSPTVLVAVTDDGVAIGHPDLAANIWTNPGETAGNGKDDDGNGYIDDVNGWDVNQNDNTVTPAGDQTHGTHVSGILAARTDNSVGVAGVAGGGNGKGDGVRIVPLRWDGTNDWTASRVAEAYSYAANMGCKIISSSYNFDDFATSVAVINACNYAYGKGVLLIGSAGNNNTNVAPREVLTQFLHVANLDSNDVRSSSSNYGDYVDISGHGDNILSTTTSSNGTVHTYANLTGTSMSTPHVSGVAALIWSQNPTFTRDQVAARLLITTDSVAKANPTFPGLLGTGRVNANRALTESNPAPRFGDVEGLPASGSSGTVSSFTIVTPQRLAPAGVTFANFELRGAGADQLYDTVDDNIIPLRINDGAAYRMGTNSLEFASTFGGDLPPDLYRFTGFSGGSRLRDPFGQALDGDENGVAGGDFQRFFSTRLSTVVTDNIDSGAGSLRQAVLNANINPGLDTITFGGGIFSVPRTITLTSGQITISERVTIQGPGASSLTISGNDVSRIFNTDAAPAAASIKLSGLTLTNGNGTDGGAIFVGNESVTISDSVIQNNFAGEDGGAINVQGTGSLFLLRSTVSGNTANDDGGGIYFNNGGGAYLVDSALVNNKALNGNGGGLYFFGSTTGLTTISSTIAGNSAAAGGGGILLNNFSGTLNVVNSTVTANSTFDKGGGGIALLSGSGAISLSGSIVSGNNGPSNAPDILSGGTVNVQYSAIGSTTGFTLSGANNLVGQNLKLRALANNGGPTPTVAFEYDSPLRGKGVGGIFTTDQRGFPRDADGVDIGAFELQTTVVNTNNIGPGSLRDAVFESDRVAGTDTINFGSAFNTPQTINLQTGEIGLTDAVTIQGNGESLTRISALGISRVFNTAGVPAGKTVTLRGLTLTAGRIIGGNGGAVLVDDEHLAVEDSVISSSTAGDHGGGIYVGAAGKLSLVRSSVIGNSAGSTGGAIEFLNGGNSEIIASSMVGNKAAIGGAVFLSGQGSGVTVLNSTLSGNSAVHGGGIDVTEFIGALTIRNSTLTANSATSGGGGGLDIFNGTPNIHIESTVISGNTASSGPDIKSTTTLTINRSAIGSAAGFTLTGTNNLPFGTNLKLGVLADNGGPTLTHLPAFDSPLVNAGSNPAGLAKDQRGVSRTLFDATDIGSVETTIAPPDTTPPTIKSITSTAANGTYGTGTPIGINIIFSESVTLTGILNVTLDTGAVVSISGPQTGESFGGSYTIAAGQNSPDLNVAAVNLSGGTLRDAADNDAKLTLPISNLAVNKDIVVSTPPIDNSAPTITSVTSPTPNGTYAAGAAIGVNLTFSEPVTLSGGLLVFFDSGGSMAIQGPQTATTLSGTYTVGAGQNSPDLNVIAASLDANSSLLDAGGNKTLFTMPTGNNLADNSNLIVGNVSTQAFTVTNTNDSGAGSLRQAVLDANNTAGLQTIAFDSSFNTSKTITLSGGTLLISDAVIITGKGATLTTIHGNGNRLFRLDPAAANVAISFSGLTFTGGNAGNGGAFFVENEVLTLTDVRVTGNNANSGAGIHISNGGRVNLINSTLSGNTASQAGGAVNIYNGSFSIQNSSIINNAAAFGNKYSIGGAGINFFGTANGTLQVINSTISGNTTSSAGGGLRLHDFNGTLTINNSTITDNSSYLGGGGIHRSGTGSGNIGLQSSIISGNSGGTNIVASGTINASYSAVGPGSGFYLFGPGNLPSNANLKLATLSAVPGSIQFVHLPAGDSPVLNAGINPSSLITDQRGPGYPRVLDGKADIGAAEVPVAPPSTVVTNTNDSGDGSLRQAILNANSNAGPDTVSFDPTFFATPRTITLGGTHFAMTDTSGATTIIGPGVNLLTISGNNLSRVFQVNGGVTASLAGMTITSGNSTNGGAVQNSGTIAVTNSRFTSNKSDNGGAIYNVGAISVMNCTFDNNAANSGNGWGGALINGTTVGVASVTACTFTNNTASNLGGAVIGYSFNITDSTFTNNTAGLNGGALRTDGTVVITGSTFSGNSAANDGGAIMSHATTTITNSTLANNTASIGGGVYFFQGTGTVRNVTVAYNTSKNTAGNIGGGLQAGTSAAVTAVNTLVAGNTAASGLNVGGTLDVSSSNNVLNLSAAAAGLGVLAGNGGVTQTIALSPNSPAVNAGMAAGAPATDQRGLPRAGATDIGAYELQAVNNVLGLIINDGASQRSRVSKVQVFFANPLDVTTLGAITFTRTSGGTVGTVVNAGGGLVMNPAAGTVNSITLTFQNIDTAGLDFGSLADGRWQLAIPGLGYTSTANDTALRRLFGDANNDGTVNAQDLADFGNAFGQTAVGIAFDFNNDGTINAQDLAEFGNRFGITL